MASSDWSTCIHQETLTSYIAMYLRMFVKTHSKQGFIETKADIYKTKSVMICPIKAVNTVNQNTHSQNEQLKC